VKIGCAAAARLNRAPSSASATYGESTHAANTPMRMIERWWLPTMNIATCEPIAATTVAHFAMR